MPQSGEYLMTSEVGLYLCTFSPQGENQLVILAWLVADLELLYHVVYRQASGP